MNIIEAVNSGKAFKRNGPDKPVYLHVTARDASLALEKPCAYAFTKEDILADDWEILPVLSLDQPEVKS